MEARGLWQGGDTCFRNSVVAGLLFNRCADTDGPDGVTRRPRCSPTTLRIPILVQIQPVLRLDCALLASIHLPSDPHNPAPSASPFHHQMDLEVRTSGRDLVRCRTFSSVRPASVRQTRRSCLPIGERRLRRLHLQTGSSVANGPGLNPEPVSNPAWSVPSNEAPDH